MTDQTVVYWMLGMIVIFVGALAWVAHKQGHNEKHHRH